MKKPPGEVRFRDLVINPPLLLAPMAGLTHTAFRQVLCGFGGVGLLSTEMLSAKRLPSDNPAISPYLVRTAAERPLSYQLLTSSATEIGRAVDVLHACHADAIDLNMGCPAPSVGKFGGGVGLMGRPDEVRRIVAEARRRTRLPLSAKIRLGAEPDDRTLKEFCLMLQDEGIDLLSVHARLKHESFARKPRWEEVAKIKGWLGIPVIANGGIFTAQDAAACLDASRADGLMIGRGAAVRPWLFAQISRDLYGRDIAAPSPSLPAVYGRFLDLLEEHFRPERRLGRLKEFTHYFAGNYAFGHHLASAVQASSSMEEARERAGRFFATACSGG